MAFTPTFFALLSEGSLVRSSLALGLTELRNASIGERGRYYTAFFQLSTALERLAKLVFILDHMVSYSLAPPGGDAVKAFGHDLEDLYRASADIGRSRQFPSAYPFPANSVSLAIVSFLSRFAETARYANLDALASGNAVRDPLADWHDILIDIIRKHVPERTRQRIEAESVAIADAKREVVLARAHDLTNRPLCLQALLATPRLYSIGTRHATWYCFELFLPLRDLVTELSHHATHVEQTTGSSLTSIPYMSDFLNFLWAPRESVLTKKRWP